MSYAAILQGTPRNPARVFPEQVLEERLRAMDLAVAFKDKSEICRIEHIIHIGLDMDPHALLCLDWIIGQDRFDQVKMFLHGLNDPSRDSFGSV